MKVSVENFQSLADAQVSVDGLTVIVGPSNSGKSALIRAITAALFNKPGDAFVRVGEKTAKVELLNAPTCDGKVLIDLTWEKGRTPAVYTIGSGVGAEIFTKVGKGVPLAIEEAGYRDVELKDDTLRPQIAGQMERLFLLDNPGSMLVDALAASAKLGVFSGAVEACAADLRVQASSAKLVNAKLVALDGARALVDPVAEVWLVEARSAAAHYASNDEAIRRIKEAEALVDRLKRARVVLLDRFWRFPDSYTIIPDPICPTPEVLPDPRPVITARVALRGLRRGQAVVMPLAVLPLLPAVERLLAARRASGVCLRARVVANILLTTPRPLPTPPFGTLAVAEVRRLIAARRRALGVATAGVGFVMIPFPTAIKVREIALTVGQLRPVVAGYRQARGTLTRAEASHGQVKSMLAHAAAALDTFRKEHPSCPTCQTPWPETAASGSVFETPEAVSTR